MKKSILIFLVLFISYISYSQSCEQREDKMLEMIGGFSAGLLYNTYGVIGAVADGYEKDAYSPGTVTDLMTAQKAMIENIIKLIGDNMKAATFTKEKDKSFAQSLTNILASLQQQAALLIDITDTNSRKKKDAYEQKRKENWSAISRLMGIAE